VKILKHPVTKKKKKKKLVKPLLEGYEFGLRMACIVGFHQSILR
jgi:hypothetical protein